jgi:hypothetical protein
MGDIIDTTNRKYIDYKKIFFQHGRGAHNGAYYYSKEIVENIIPNVKTDRPWDTLGMRPVGSKDHAIVFIHSNINLEKVYKWLEKYEDQIYVASAKHVYDWFVENGKRTILLPLSVDVDYVAQFRAKKTKGACYSGNRWKFKRADEEKNIPKDVDFPLANLPREELLKFIAPYRELYAVGRCAIEGLILGCKIRPFYWRYMDPSLWRILDNKDAAKLLQIALDMVEHDGHSVNGFDLLEYKKFSKKG